MRLFSDVLVLGPGVPMWVASSPAVRHLAHAAGPAPRRHSTGSPGSLRPPFWWWTLAVPSRVHPLREPSGSIPEGSALDQAFSWLDHLWDEAPEVARPAFAVLEDVLTRGARSGRCD